VLDVVVGERCHEVVRVIVVWTVVDLHVVESLFASHGLEVLGEKLALLVEVVAGALGGENY
jgi:hypothetical protein